ncbi:hypothetical protein JV173_05775 [Acholeplasma equirhinis]|uniref:hypothetical protein n=1 Tax=Acholeplasma equirhinis TaxID=555393 RepID=UPI00197A84DB|nr:hypothetical protein [Acholeplasma equirhinis]MBN3491023.1 hypothetical protein [Acholeplasma equirhinis]
MKKILLSLFFFNLIFLSGCSVVDNTPKTTPKDTAIEIYQEFLDNYTFKGIDVKVKMDTSEFYYHMQEDILNMTTRFTNDKGYLEFRYNKQSKVLRQREYDVNGEVLNEKFTEDFYESLYKALFFRTHETRIYLDLEKTNEHNYQIEPGTNQLPEGRNDHLKFENHESYIYRIFDRLYEFDVTDLFMNSSKSQNKFKLYSYTVKGIIKDSSQPIEIRINAV